MTTSKPRILLVDDDRSNIHLLGSMLQQDYEISVAMNGEQALQLVASELSLDALLLDVQMPGMSGIDVTRTLRSSQLQFGDNASIPIVAITASTDTRQHDEARGAGVSAVLIKPVAPATLLAELARLLV